MNALVIPDIPIVPVVPMYPAMGSPTFNQEAFTYGRSMPGVTSRLHAIAQAARDCALAARADALAVAADRLQTGRDREQTGLDRVATGEDRIHARQDREAVAADRLQTGRDREQTGLDCMATGEDRVQTGQDREAAIAARDQAEVFATSQLKATSTTSVTPGAGAKSFAIEPSRSFVAGMYLVATSAGDLATSLSGFVQSYSAATGALVLNVDAFRGSDVRADWVIGIAAPEAAAGGARQGINADAIAVPNVHYVFTGPVVTLTLPDSGWQDGDRFEVSLAAALTYTQCIDFRGFTVGGQVGGLRFINRRGWQSGWIYDATLGGFV